MGYPRDYLKCCVLLSRLDFVPVQDLERFFDENVLVFIITELAN